MNKRQGLWLQSFQVSGVRGIGWGDEGHSGLEVPELGQVTLIAAPNGIGKSSIIHALNLGLSGEASRRRASLTYDELRHQANFGSISLGNSTSESQVLQVKLNFRDGERFNRRKSDMPTALIFKASTTSEFDEQKMVLGRKGAELLSAERAGLHLGDIRDPLRLTHFLPQGVGGRTTDLEGEKDGWLLFERAMAIEGLRDAVANADGRGGVIGSLNTASQGAQAELDQAKEVLKAWETAAKQLEEARTNSQAGGALSPEQVAEHLIKRFADFRDSPWLREALPTPVALKAALDGGLNLIEEIIRRLEATLANQAELVSRLGVLLKDWPEILREVQKLGIEAKQAQEAAQGAKASLEEAEKQEELLRLGVLHLEVEALSLNLKGKRGELSKLKDEQQSLHSMHDLRTLLGAEREAADLADRAAKLAETSKNLPDTVSLGERVSEAQGIKEDAKAALMERVEMNQVLRTQAGALEGLLSQLIPHVENRPDTCPVCNARYGDGELIKELRASIERLGSDALGQAGQQEAIAQAALRAAQENLTLAEKRLESSQKVKAKYKTAFEAHLAHQAALRRRLEGLHTPLKLNTWEYTPPEMLARVLAKEIAGFEGPIVPPDLDEQLARVRLDLDRAKQEERSISIELETQKQALEQGLSINPGVALRLGELTTLEEAKIQLAAREERRKELTANHQRAVEDQALAERSRDEAENTKASTLGQWQGANLEGEPNINEIERLRRANTARQAMVREWNATLEQMKAGAEAYQRARVTAQASQALESLIPKDLDPVPSTPLDETEIRRIEQHLENKVEVAKESEASAQRRVARFRQIRGGLKKCLTHTKDTQLPRILERQSQFFQALAPSLSWDLHADRKRDKLFLAVKGQESPRLANLLSEGEQTAVALSFLFAFHIEYPWSRWPALILDDPFQASDVVRVASLLDVLRGIALGMGSQIIITTHDIERARWAKRKMDNAGINTRAYSLHRCPWGLRTENIP